MLLCMMWLTGFAQKAITGTVKDKTGEPLIGVSVTYGSGQGTVTDFDGNFSVDAPEGTPIKLSYIGFKPQTLSGKANMDIVLEEDNTTLEDVVVIGYGTMKRKDLTGSVSSVTGDKLSNVPVATVSEALQGKLSGVNVIAQDGRPGAALAIRVRGGGSITQSNDPLFIVDGIAVSSIDDIPADQIESIDVLKDASSTAIYGARGANGVILVTTKGAKEGKATVHYNMYYQIKAKPKLMDVQDAYTFVRKTWEYATAFGSKYGDGVAKYYGLGSKYGNHLNEYKNVTAHNWMDDVFETGHMWNHDLSLSGGTEKTKYYAAVSYTNDATTMKNSGFNRWNINLKLQQQLAKTLKVDIDARYSETKTQQNRFFSSTHSNNTLVYPWMYNSIDNPLGSGDYTDLFMGGDYANPQYNPVAVINDNNYTKWQQRARLNTGLTWNPIAGLTAKTELALSRYWNKTQNWNGRETGRDKGTSTATLGQGNGYSVDWTTTLNYDFDSIIKNDDHKLGILIGNEVIGGRSYSSSIKGVGFPEGWGENEAFGQIHMATERIKSDFTNEIGVSSHTISWFGRINYNLLSRYMFTFTMRADGSSKFAEGNRWGYFPAGAVAWRISDEPFMASAQKWLDNLKLRLSIGTSGNDGIDAAAFLDEWIATKSTVDGSYSYAKGTLKGNPNLTWETTISRNIGLDYSFLNGKFNGSIDFYWNTTKDCLMRVPVQPAYGFTYQYQNVAKTSNKGIEFAFNYNIIDKKDLSLSFGITYNYNVNKVEKVVSANLGVSPNYASTALLPKSDMYTIIEGEPVGLIQGFVADGFYTVDDFNVIDGVWTLKDGILDTNVKNSLAKYQGSNNYKLAGGQGAFPGMPKYKDVNEDGKIDVDDITIIGRMPAKHTGGFNLSGRYKAVDFNANFAYQLDGKVYNANYARSVFSGINDNYLGMTRLASRFDNSWSMYDIDGNGDLLLITDPTTLAAQNQDVAYGLLGYTSGNAHVTSDYIESAAFLRLQSLTIGYTFPKLLVNKIGIKNARAYFTAGNLFCIKGYDGLDPDVNTDSAMSSSYAGFPTPGYDYNSYPRSRTFTFGLNVAF